MSSLKRKYGMSPEEYQALLAEQDGKCAICRTEKGEEKRGRRLFVDHDHKTGTVRGLLCGRCNSTLGFLAEDLERVHAMQAYLTRWM